MARTYRSQKAALTRAIKTEDPDKVREECRKAKREWEAQGYWPDDWSRWQRALDDVMPWNTRVDLEDL